MYQYEELILHIKKKEYNFPVYFYRREFLYFFVFIVNLFFFYIFFCYFSEHKREWFQIPNIQVHRKTYRTDCIARLLRQEELKRTILVYSHRQFFTFSFHKKRQRRLFIHEADILVLMGREAHFDERARQRVLWDRARIPRVNWHLFPAIRYDEFSHKAQ